MEFKHIPVLFNECLEGLNINPSGVYIDCTIGGAGHSIAILKKLTSGKLIGFDKDAQAIEVCKERLQSFSNVELINTDFKNAPDTLQEMGINQIDGVLIDLGVSSYQIDTPERGFSFLHDGKLDMRMDKSQQLSAYEVVNEYSSAKLLQILYKYGEESNAKRIVEKICQARAENPIETTTQLKQIIESAFPKKILYGRGGVSKRTFQAIRIEVNGELNGLENCLKRFIQMLKPSGGRFCMISFHSLEDRIVKTIFKDACTDCICPPKIPICICKHRAVAKMITRKPIVASEEELKYNNRSSSAKLRIIEKI